MQNIFETDNKHDVSWEVVLRDWQEAEEDAWRSFYTARGYDTWTEWRESYQADLDLAARAWHEIIVEHPHTIIPKFSVGGYRGWKKYRPAGIDTASFLQIVERVHPEELSYEGTERADVRTNEKVSPLLGNIHNTTILVLKSPTITAVLDGSHRCAALSLELVDELQFSDCAITVRFADFDATETTLLEKFCKDRPSAVRKKND